MMLGDMLAAARKSAGRFQAWLEGSNPALAAQVVERAAIQGLSPAAYVRVAVADFASLASEEDWATLLSRLPDSGHRGTVCPLALGHWRLSAHKHRKAVDCGNAGHVRVVLGGGPIIQIHSLINHIHLS